MNKTILQQTFAEQKLDLIFSTAPQTRLWFTKVDSSAGFLFLTKNQGTLFLDGRYIEVGKKMAQNVDVMLYDGLASLENFIKNKKYSRIGIEQDYLTISEFEFAKKLFPNAEFVHISGQKLRIIKSAEEAHNIAKAGSIALQALEQVKHLIKPGIKETQIDAELEKAIRLLGGNKGSFDAIVASGVRSALPHGRASEKTLQAGELVTIDFGAIYQGYCSDITRTFHVGKVTDQKLLEIETILRKAQKLGIEAVKPGITTNEVDQVCRDYITKHSYGKEFVHSTGHGLGIDVHELPNVTSNPIYSTKLVPGMVITVEPGIYIEGFGGIRVEDDILVTETGYKILSQK